jgi:hypothetical protein
MAVTQGGAIRLRARSACASPACSIKASMRKFASGLPAPRYASIGAVLLKTPRTRSEMAGMA